METLVSEDGRVRTHAPGGRASGKLSPLRIGRQTTSLLKCVSEGRFLRISTFDILGHLLCCVLQSIWQYPPSLPIRCPSTCYSVATTKYIPKHWRMFPRRPNFPWLRTSALGKEVGKQKVSSSMSALRVALFGEVLQEAGELRREVTVFQTHTGRKRESAQKFGEWHRWKSLSLWTQTLRRLF